MNLEKDENKSLFDETTKAEKKLAHEIKINIAIYYIYISFI